MSGYTQSQSSTPSMPEGAPVLRHRISWGAILAGALIAIAVGAALNILGLAIGVTTVDVQAGDTPSAGNLGIAGAVWLLVSNLLGLALGGYAAARLSGTADRSDATLHGAAVWATAYLVSAVLLGSAISGAASTAGSALSSVVGGVSRGASQAVQAAAPAVDPEALVERARVALSGPSDPARMTTEQRGAEIAQLIGKRAVNGNLSGDDRTRLNRLVAAEAGISEQDAAGRVQAYEAEAQRTAQEAANRARQAADAAARGASIAAFAIFGALVLGALAAIIGARTGTRDLIHLNSRRAAV
ncbi:hypothetical protein [Muricoccus pecuniae]|uniref:PhnA-like protein n=1 Tax=Muricoccus pecuniae TaxID=693023 RepID=A0A840XVK5_9PROT|nr:hypothetical protein [Roseomonas pecuniae]MBB5692778.1 hypothetical protein [Roseomonas pecuniae]